MRHEPGKTALPVPQNGTADPQPNLARIRRRDFGVVFNRLFTLTNQPIARFAEMLRREGQWDAYLELLTHSFNPATVDGLMCRGTLSVGWTGELFDCDFNQMLALPLGAGAHGRAGAAAPRYLWDLAPAQLEEGPIATGIHCLACTAGGGSSCTGAIQS